MPILGQGNGIQPIPATSIQDTEWRTPDMALEIRVCDVQLSPLTKLLWYCTAFWVEKYTADHLVISLRVARPTVWHSVAASALHRMTSKSRRSRARSGQLQCRVSPQAIVRDKLLLVMIYSSGGTSVCSTGLLNSDAKQSISITS